MTQAAQAEQPPILWRPPDDVRDNSQIGHYLDWMKSHRALDFGDFETLWRWSVDDISGFWQSIWDFFGVTAHTPHQTVLVGDRMPDVTWFPGSTLNYAEYLLEHNDADSERVVLIGDSQTRAPVRWTMGRLRDEVARIRAGLEHLGVEPGDRIAAYLPNIPETIAAFLAAASLGAVWASCAPEFGARSVIDRLRQLEPRLLLAVSGYGYRDRYVDRRDEVAKIRAALPGLEHTIEVPYGRDELPDAIRWVQLRTTEAEMRFAPVPFDHPLYVLFSSGTTGPPKAIVHRHGGILLEHLKALGLGFDVGPGDRLLQFTTTGWMMWNLAVSTLSLGASLTLLDGDPMWPGLRNQWELAASTGATIIGTSPGFIMACRKAGVELADLDLTALRTVFTAGAPLPAEGYRWFYEQLGPDRLLINGSGGTDICSALVSGTYWQPVYEGEISGRCLGVDVRAFSPEGEELVGQPGEMIVASPMPSMPAGFWGDGDGSRYRAAYFEDFPGFWRQGDWITLTDRGTSVISGRSDATLNRGGVRIGTGEIYSAVEDLNEVADSLVLHLEDPEGGAGRLILFVELVNNQPLSDATRELIRTTLRTDVSPRHVPDEIVAVPAIPRTLTGKKLETPVKRILQGAAESAVASRDALADPAALDAFVVYADHHRRNKA